VSDLIDNLNYIIEIKDNIKTVFNSKGGSVSTELLESYPTIFESLVLPKEWSQSYYESVYSEIEWSESYWQAIYDESLTKPDIVVTIPDFSTGVEVIYFVVNIII